MRVYGQGCDQNMMRRAQVPCGTMVWNVSAPRGSHHRLGASRRGRARVRGRPPRRRAQKPAPGHWGKRYQAWGQPAAGAGQLRFGWRTLVRRTGLKTRLRPLEGALERSR